MKINIKKILFLSIAGALIILLSPNKAQASFNLYKTSIIPEKLRGTWYTTPFINLNNKTKITAKSIGLSKYTSSKVKRLKYPGAGSEKFFTPYLVKGNKVKPNTLLLVNGSGLQLVRYVKANNTETLVQYNQQNHVFVFSIWTKKKHSNVQKSKWTSNPYGQGVNTKKQALQNAKDYKYMNPYLKKYFAGALKHKKITMKAGRLKGTSVAYYDINLNPKTYAKLFY